MITIVNYRAGNLASVRKGFQHLGLPVEITSDPETVARARALVVPGVGNFQATAFLESTGLSQAIRSAVEAGAMMLGICLGMQWLFEGSDEAPALDGLAAFPGICRKFPPEVKSPHVGWNTVRQAAPSRLLAGLPEDFFVYYTHSYRAPAGHGTVGTTEYGGAFAAVVERENLFGAQFHPEKSGNAGLQMLRNFVRIAC